MPDFGVQVSVMRYNEAGELIHEDEAAINEVTSEEGAPRQQDHQDMSSDDLHDNVMTEQVSTLEELQSNDPLETALPDSDVDDEVIDDEDHQAMSSDTAHDNVMTEQVLTSEELQLLNPLAHLLPDSDSDDSDYEVIYEEYDPEEQEVRNDGFFELDPGFLKLETKVCESDYNGSDSSNAAEDNNVDLYSSEESDAAKDKAQEPNFEVPVGYFAEKIRNLKMELAGSDDDCAISSTSGSGAPPRRRRESIRTPAAPQAPIPRNPARAKFILGGSPSPDFDSGEGLSPRGSRSRTKSEAHRASIDPRAHRSGTPRPPKFLDKDASAKSKHKEVVEKESKSKRLPYDDTTSSDDSDPEQKARDAELMKRHGPIHLGSPKRRAERNGEDNDSDADSVATTESERMNRHFIRMAEEELEKPLAFEKPDVPYMETEHAKEYLGHGRDVSDIANNQKKDPEAQSPYVSRFTENFSGDSSSPPGVGDDNAVHSDEDHDHDEGAIPRMSPRQERVLAMMQERFADYEHRRREASPSSSVSSNTKWAGIAEMVRQRDDPDRVTESDEEDKPDGFSNSPADDQLSPMNDSDLANLTQAWYEFVGRYEAKTQAPIDLEGDQSFIAQAWEEFVENYDNAEGDEAAPIEEPVRALSPLSFEKIPIDSPRRYSQVPKPGEHSLLWKLLHPEEVLENGANTEDKPQTVAGTPDGSRPSPTANVPYFDTDGTADTDNRDFNPTGQVDLRGALGIVTNAQIGSKLDNKGDRKPVDMIDQPPVVLQVFQASMDNNHGGAADGNPSVNKPAGEAEGRGDGKETSSQDDPSEDKSSEEEKVHTEEPKPYITLSPHGKCLDPSRHYRAMSAERVGSFVDTKRVILMCGCIRVRPETAINYVVDDRGPLGPKDSKDGETAV